ncbi:MAG: serine--tRNA ligase [SAR324 cluster bacterium]|nr:serine--tRNA ligase [SAR324 cluster bacterium]MBF0350002.1 serine--tRNA ligase [SAR324 cluster bacterium]
MLDLNFVRENSNAVIENCRLRHVSADVSGLLDADSQARTAKGKLDQIRQRRNEISQIMKGKLSPEERQPLVEEAKSLREQESEKEKEYDVWDQKRMALLASIPNMTHPQSPQGLTDDDHKVLHYAGTPRQFEFKPKDHLELMEKLDLLDMEGGAKVSGQKFYYLKNEAALLEIALVQFAMKLLKNEGFTLFTTPDLARRDILTGIGFNPRGDETQIYSIENSDLCLIATAEITLGGLMANQILKEENMPLLYAGFSHCFRTEAGAAGKESRGLYRVHQFSKVEMFAFTHPDQSEAMHEKFLRIEEKIYQELQIPYRVVDICTGDLGAPAYRKFDIEAWMPGRGKWGEVTSTSNCTDYQSRRLNIRYKDKDTGKNRFVHMLNGTAIATSRTLIGLIENGQQMNGDIHLPKCLGLSDITR